MPHKAAYDGKNRSGWKPVVSTAAIHLAGLSPNRRLKAITAAREPQGSNARYTAKWYSSHNPTFRYSSS